MGRVKRAAAPARVDSLPHALTFFLSGGERRRVLAALRRVHPDRRVALARVVRLANRGTDLSAPGQSVDIGRDGPADPPQSRRVSATGASRERGSWRRG